MIGKTTTLFVAFVLLLVIGETESIRDMFGNEVPLERVIVSSGPNQRLPLPISRPLPEPKAVYVTQTPKIVYVTSPPEVVTVLVNSATLINYGLGASLVFILLATL